MKVEDLFARKFKRRTSVGYAISQAAETSAKRGSSTSKSRRGLWMRVLVGTMEVDEIESKDITAADFSELEEQKWDGLGQVVASRHLVHADFPRGEVGNSRCVWN